MIINKVTPSVEKWLVETLGNFLFKLIIYDHKWRGLKTLGTSVIHCPISPCLLVVKFIFFRNGYRIRGLIIGGNL